MVNSSQGQLDSLLNAIWINCNPSMGSEQCFRFSLDCLSLIKHKLPAIAVEAIVMMNDYRAGGVQRQAVIDMRAALWLYLGNRDQDLDDTEVCVIRAVICPLHDLANPEMKDILESLSFLLELVNNVEPHYDEEEALLRKHFAECLEPR